MIDIHKINNYLIDLLEPDKFSDYGINGIQIENDNKNISKIAFTVDTCQESIHSAIHNNCELLIVHHGIFWGKQYPITGIARDRIKLMLANDIGLIAYHLPLDSHEEIGNNIQIINKFGDGIVNKFGYDKGNYIGYLKELNNPVSIEDIYYLLNINDNDKNIKYYNFGNHKISRISVVSGSGSRYFEEAVAKKVDLYITGDADHVLYHMAKENGINLLFAGHYFTETFGINALMNVIKKEFNVKTIFFDIPTGM